jgi:translation initiation factor IF-2
MNKVRIHQIAKDLNKSTKEIIAALEKMGVTGKHHTSTIEEELVDKIKKHFHRGSTAAAPPKRKAAASTATRVKSSRASELGRAVAVAEAPAEPEIRQPAAQAPAPAKPQRSRPQRAERPVTAAHPVPDVTEEELERLTAPPEVAEAVPEASVVVEARPKIQISENIPVKDLAQKLGVMSKILLKKLLDRGVLANLNQNLELKMAEQLANEFGYDVQVTTYEEVVAREQEADETPASLFVRPPVVTIMGHVDHGKTSLLDAIRESNITSRESGGITQHIGAYQVNVSGRAITFIDTPGHEAFTRMRARGALVTDIVVLVVAADDGVMPQTLEAIDHARAAKVPMVVAINKIDKPEANPDRIKQQLSQHNVLIEEYGGDTVCVEISARKKTNINGLLDMILLVADILELKASPGRLATGTILEARLDKTRGPIATVLVQNGALHVGDVFVAGAVMGRVRAMFNDVGEKMKEATPGYPVEVLGFQGVPQAGDSFQIFKDEFKARSIVAFRQVKVKEAATRATSSRLSLDQLFTKIQQGEIRELPIIIKADVQGSIEVLTDTLTKLGTSEVKIRTIHSGTGAITESDVLLASASNAIIIGYNVRPEPKARDLAEKEEVDVRIHTIIYNIVSEIKSALEGLLQPTLKEVFVGSVEVRDTFRIPKVGVIAGCYVVSGKITRNASVRLLRDNVVVYEGKISSLRRFKEDASEVKEGFECGVGLENYNDVKIGDFIEAFAIEKIARQLT